MREVVESRYKNKELHLRFKMCCGIHWACHIFDSCQSVDCFSNVPMLFGFLGSSKRRRKEELLGKPFRRPQHELDSNGLVPLPVKVCFSCNRLVLADFSIFKDVHTEKFHILCWFPCFFFTGVAGWLHWSSVTIVPFCSTWTVWTLHSQLYRLANGCVQTM